MREVMAAVEGKSSVPEDQDNHFVAEVEWEPPVAQQAEAALRVAAPTPAPAPAASLEHRLALRLPGAASMAPPGTRKRRRSPSLQRN